MGLHIFNPFPRILLLLLPVLSLLHCVPIRADIFVENQYFDNVVESIEKKQSVKEMITAVMKLRNDLVCAGYKVPEVREIAWQVMVCVEYSEITVRSEEMEEILSEIDRQEVRIKKTFLEEGEGTPAENKFAIGFVKCIGGALLLIIPNESARVFGSALVFDGMKDIFQSDVMEKKQEEPPLPEVPELEHFYANN